MIVRIVRMTFDAKDIATFKSHFATSYPLIRNFEGCENLQLFEDKDQPNVMITYSYWRGQEHLDNYRKSDVFKSTWAKVKPLFIAAPQAFSMVETKY
jgi:quinol monooxygenase YgiN